MKNTITLTEEEKKAITALKRVAKIWPDTLMLFSWSGSLCITKDSAIVADILGIRNDGGDPDSFHEIDQHPDITYE